MCSGCRVPTVERALTALVLALCLGAPVEARPTQDVARAWVAPNATPAPVRADRSSARRAEDFGIDRICDLIEASAARYALPPSYFARLIWKESRFDVAALSPVGAQGIAQFMPGTAKLEGLADPFDPVQAIPASARHLSDLRSQFGNLGLAAAAYNSGRNRVDRWLRGKGGLPYETRDYVQSITHRPAEWFRERSREVEPKPLDKERPFATACRRLPIMKTRAVFAAGAPLQPWGAQVAGGISPSAAARGFERVRRRFPAMIASEAPQVVRNRKGMGLRYTAQVGQPSRSAAIKFCQRMSRAGGACVVRRN